MMEKSLSPALLHIGTINRIVKSGGMIMGRKTARTYKYYKHEHWRAFQSKNT